MSVGQTLSQKILARASAAESPQPGQIITCDVDLAMMHDSGGPRRVESRLQELGATIWDADKVVLVSDHFVPAIDEESAEILSLTRRFARDRGIAKFYDMQGICHVVIQERGLLQPGMFAVGGDSHSPSGGAFGAFMIGIGATEMTGVLVTGKIWVRVPENVLITWNGIFQDGVSAKDVMLFLCAQLGMSNDYQVFEYAGSAVSAMSMAERMVLCNMSAELGCKTAIIAADATTLDALERAGRPFRGDIAEWQSDADATYLSRHEYDASSLAPQIAAPHSPANSKAVDQYDRVVIDQAYIGACTGAKLTDLHMAARILKGRKVATGTRLLVAPASTRVTEEAIGDGTMLALTQAGAILLPTGCGACAGLGAGVLANGEVCLASTARNFKGRMGSPGAMVYLGSPYSVAAAAVAGHITDPREMLAEIRA